MTADEFIARHRSDLEKNNGWELRFVKDVLCRVDGLDFRYVEPQTDFVDRSGGRRRIDFTITEPDGPVLGSVSPGAKVVSAAWAHMR